MRDSEAHSRVRLKYLAHLEMGQSPPSTMYTLSPEDGLPFLQGTADFGVQFPEPKVYCDSPTKIAITGDILFSVRAPVGELNIARQNTGIGRGLCAIRPNKDWVFRFAWWAIHEARYQLNFESTGSTYEAVSTEDVANMPVELAPVFEQRAIADYLDDETARLDGLVAAKERVLGLLAEKRRALIARAVTRGLDPRAPLRDSGIPWLGEIPAHWPLVRAKFLWQEQSLPVRKDDEMVTCFRDGQVTLRKNRREEGFTNAIKELGYQGVRAGQLVLHSMDAFAGAIGVCDSDGKCTPEYIICNPVRVDVSNPYFGFLLRVMALNGFIQASCTAVRERAPRIHFSDFGNMFFPLPPLGEQHGIVAHITEETAKLNAMRSATERTVALLKERRAALIAAAVTGKIAIPSKNKMAKECQNAI
ncbi:MAG: restriction endonuclease subunit S [Acidobacteriia bacterium]|nr:restriction endonuclease subunit S [Terriglobia bacterium]